MSTKVGQALVEVLLPKVLDAMLVRKQSMNVPVGAFQPMRFVFALSNSATPHGAKNANPSGGPHVAGVKRAVPVVAAKIARPSFLCMLPPEDSQ